MAGPTPSEPPEYAVWIRETPADRFGVVSLAGGPETPRLFVASAEAGEDNSEDNTLRALDLQSGEGHWHVGVDHPVQTPPMNLETDDRTRFVFATGRTSRFDVRFVVQAVDPVSGERARAFEPDVDGYVHVEAGAPSTVFAHADRQVWALDPDTGDPRWAFTPGEDLAGVETAGEYAFVGVDGTVYGLDGTESR